ncbi:MAG: HAD family hydrolase [Chloroflexi bacterium]|nr:HAD family hydrolase [Chloroflexota bacterium]
MIKAIISDVDGTLIDSNYLHVESFARAFREVGREVPRSAIHRQIGKGSDQLLPEFFSDELARKLANELHSKYFADLQRQSYPLPGAKELIASLFERGYSVWPLLRRGIVSHLQRFPWLDTGLGVVETTILTALASESRPFPGLFRAVTRADRIRHFGLGDHQVLVYTSLLASSDPPLVDVSDPNWVTDYRRTGAVSRECRFSLTEPGRYFLAGARGQLRHAVERWLGGVRLDLGGTAWQWDESRHTIVHL